jgi:hypothetical protein
MQDELQQARTKKIIDDAERVLAEADAALEAGRRFYAAKGIDRAALDAQLKRMGKEPAFRALLDRTMDEIRHDAAAAQLHSRFDPPPQSSAAPAGRVRRLRNMI